MQADDERAFTEYVHGQSLVLRRTAYRLCGDWHHAHDLVQTTLVQLYRHWRKANDADSLDAYVRKMLVNNFLAERRRWWARRVRTMAQLPEESRSDSDPAGRLDVHRALAKLSKGQRAVVVLRFWEGLDVAQTADALGISTGTVKSQTSYAMTALRKLLPGYALEAS